VLYNRQLIIVLLKYIQNKIQQNYSNVKRKSV